MVKRITRRLLTLTTACVLMLVLGACTSGFGWFFGTKDKVHVPDPPLLGAPPLSGIPFAFPPYGPQHIAEATEILQSLGIVLAGPIEELMLDAPITRA